MKPKGTESRPRGNMALCKLQLGLPPKVSVSLLLGSVTPHRLWKRPWRKVPNLRWRQPAKVNVSRLRGTLTRGKHWWGLNPKVRDCRTFHSMASRQRDPARTLIEPEAKVSDYRMHGGMTLCKLRSNL